MSWTPLTLQLVCKPHADSADMFQQYLALRARASGTDVVAHGERLFGQDMRAVSDIAFGCRLPKRTVARFLTFRIRRLPANLKKGRASACDRWCSSVAVYTICPQGVFSTCLRIREKTFNHDIDPYAMY